jgi:hypothetical protein
VLSEQFISQQSPEVSAAQSRQRYKFQLYIDNSMFFIIFEMQNWKDNAY